MKTIAVTITRGNIIERHRIGENRVIDITQDDGLIFVKFDDDSQIIYRNEDLFSIVEVPE